MENKTIIINNARIPRLHSPKSNIPYSVFTPTIIKTELVSPTVRSQTCLHPITKEWQEEKGPRGALMSRPRSSSPRFGRRRRPWSPEPRAPWSLLQLQDFSFYRNIYKNNNKANPPSEENVGARPAFIKRHEQERRVERRRAERRNQPGEQRRGSAVGASWREICLYLLAVLSSGEGVAWWRWRGRGSLSSSRLPVSSRVVCCLLSAFGRFGFVVAWRRPRRNKMLGQTWQPEMTKSATTRRPGGGPPFGQSFPRNMASKIKSFL